MFAVLSAPIWRNYLAASVAAGALCSPFPATRRVFWRCKDLRDLGGLSHRNPPLLHLRSGKGTRRSADALRRHGGPTGRLSLINPKARGSRSK